MLELEEHLVLQLTFSSSARVPTEASGTQPNSVREGTRSPKRQLRNRKNMERRVKQPSSSIPCTVLSNLAQLAHKCEEIILQTSFSSLKLGGHLD